MLSAHRCGPLICFVQYADLVAPRLAECLDAATATTRHILAAAPPPDASQVAADNDAVSAANWTRSTERAFGALSQLLQEATPVQEKWKSWLSATVRSLLEALLAAPQDSTQPMFVGLREAVVQRWRERALMPTQPLPLLPADAAALLLQVAHHLVLLPASGGPTSLASPPAAATSSLAWAVAKQAVGPATAAGLLPPQQAAEVARGACLAIDVALRPLRQPGTSSPDSSSSQRASAAAAALPTLPFMSAATHVAAAAACSAADGGVVAEQVADALLTLVEDSCTIAAELGVGDRVAGGTLRAAAVAARELRLPLSSCLAAQRTTLPNLLARLQPLLVSCPPPVCPGG